MKTNRRPIIIVSLALWIGCLMFLTRSLLFAWPLLVLLSFREKSLWMLVFLIIRLMVLPIGNEAPFTGEVEIRPLSYAQENAWQVKVEGRSFLYQGKLPGAGTYEVDATRETFRTNRSESGYSEHDYYHAQGLVGRLSIASFEPVRIIELPLRYRLQSILYERLIGFGESRDLAFALLFGGSRLLDDDLEQALKDVGLLHLIVVSGLHLQIYDRTMERLLRFVGLPRTFRRLIVLLILVGLIVVTDYHPSCVRSVLLLIIRESCFVFRRRMDRLDQLALVTSVMLVINPYWASGAGFLLGTLAYGSLSYPRRPSIVRLYMVMLPFQLVLNGYLSPVYILFNLVLAALMDQVLPLMVLTIIIKPIQFLGEWWLLGLRKIIEELHQVDLLRLEVMAPAPFVTAIILVFYCLLLLSLQSKEARRLWWQYCPRVFVGLIALILMVQTIHLRELRGVHFLDVGQGDATIIQTQSGQRILIDTSKSQRLFQHMRSLGIYEFNYVFITHRDDDHAAWVDQLRFSQGYTSGSTPLAGFTPLYRGDRLEIDGIKIEVLHPDREYPSENDNSLVLRIDAYGDTFLMGGDVGGHLVNADWLEGVEVYKFPHHGSIHSLSGSAVPRDIPMIVLSYGINRYQHPHPDVVAYFDLSRLHHTFYHGSIQFRGGHFRTR